MGTSGAKNTQICRCLETSKGGGRRWCQLGSEGRETKKTKICSLGSGGMGRFLSDLVRYESWRDNVHGDTEVN